MVDVNVKNDIHDELAIDELVREVDMVVLVMANLDPPVHRGQILKKYEPCAGANSFGRGAGSKLASAIPPPRALDQQLLDWVLK